MCSGAASFAGVPFSPSSPRSDGSASSASTSADKLRRMSNASELLSPLRSFNLLSPSQAVLGRGGGGGHSTSADSPPLNRTPSILRGKRKAGSAEPVSSVGLTIGAGGIPMPMPLPALPIEQDATDAMHSSLLPLPHSSPAGSVGGHHSLSSVHRGSGGVGSHSIPTPLRNAGITAITATTATPRRSGSGVTTSDALESLVSPYRSNANVTPKRGSNAPVSPPKGLSSGVFAHPSTPASAASALIAISSPAPVSAFGSTPNHLPSRRSPHRATSTATALSALLQHHKSLTNTSRTTNASAASAVSVPMEQPTTPPGGGGGLNRYKESLRTRIHNNTSLPVSVTARGSSAGPHRGADAMMRFDDAPVTGAAAVLTAASAAAAAASANSGSLSAGGLDVYHVSHDSGGAPNSSPLSRPLSSSAAAASSVHPLVPDDYLLKPPSASGSGDSPVKSSDHASHSMSAGSSSVMGGTGGDSMPTSCESPAVMSFAARFQQERMQQTLTPTPSNANSASAAMSITRPSASGLHAGSVGSGVRRQPNFDVSTPNRGGSGGDAISRIPLGSPLASPLHGSSVSVHPLPPASPAASGLYKPSHHETDILSAYNQSFSGGFHNQQQHVMMSDTTPHSLNPKISDKTLLMSQAWQIQLTPQKSSYYATGAQSTGQHTHTGGAAQTSQVPPPSPASVMNSSVASRSSLLSTPGGGGGGGGGGSTNSSMLIGSGDGPVRTTALRHTVDLMTTPIRGALNF